MPTPSFETHEEAGENGPPKGTNYTSRNDPKEMDICELLDKELNTKTSCELKKMIHEQNENISKEYKKE